jgi:hypothetical protein
VGHYGAVGALDWGGTAAATAIDGNQEGRRRSGEGVELGKGNAVEKEGGSR